MHLSAIRLTLGLMLAASLPAQDAYRAEVDAWHRERESRLSAEDGWLTLIGRDWLSPGENTLGSAPGSTVLLPEWAAPARAGIFTLDGTSLRFRPLPGSGLLLNGKPAKETPIRTDADGEADELRAGRIRFYVIRRGDRFAVRVKDPENPPRKAFHGVPRFPVDPAWRVEARFEAYATPQVRAVPNVLGTTDPMPAPGLLRFTVQGRECTLEPMLEKGDHQLFIIFKDATSAGDTYPAGRFLYADLPKDGKVVLDFNRAINPPCAFTIFATCPLPPKQNQLALSIPAGEKDPGAH